MYLNKPLNANSPMSKRMQKMFDSPYQISSVCFPHNVKLRQLHTGCTLKRQINITRLKAGRVRYPIEPCSPVTDKEIDALENILAHPWSGKILARRRCHLPCPKASPQERPASHSATSPQQTTTPQRHPLLELIMTKTESSKCPGQIPSKVSQQCFKATPSPLPQLVKHSACQTDHISLLKF